jgi:hypothetical protein
MRAFFCRCRYARLALSNGGVLRNLSAGRISLSKGEKIPAANTPAIPHWTLVLSILFVFQAWPAIPSRLNDHVTLNSLQSPLSEK